LNFRNLGSFGLQVSEIGLGCNNFGGRLDADGSRKVIYKALDLGITLFDTADVYGNRGGSETLMGEILGSRRKDIVLATKFAMPMDQNGKEKGASHCTKPAEVMRPPTRNRGKSCTRCAAARWQRYARFRSGYTMAASIRRRCS
jgi:aryl-alcohol dehydrogenase-like predicted oxidoreductase